MYEHLSLYNSDIYSLEDLVKCSTTPDELLRGGNLKIFDGKIHPLNDQQLPVIQYFEIWMRQGTQSRMIGLFRYSLESSLSSYAIVNPLTNVTIATAKVDVSIQETKERAKLWLAKCLTNENIKVLLSSQFQRNDPVDELFQTLDGTSLVPDKLQEVRDIPQNECLGTPPATEESTLNTYPQVDPVVEVAPPKFSVEPTLPTSRVLVPPNRLESQQLSTTYSIDSLEITCDENDVTSPTANIQSPPQFPSTDQSVDSLLISRLSNNSPVTETPATHILEFIVEGTVDQNIFSKESLGYFVCYNFPRLKDHEVDFMSFII